MELEEQMSRSSTNDEYLYEELTYKIRGAFFEVYNTLGPGFKEAIYHRALVVQFRLLDLPFEEEAPLPIVFKGEKIGIYKPDLVVDNKVIVEIKALPQMAPVHEKQLYSYLRGSKFKLGFLVNFGGEELDIRRRIYDTARQQNQRPNQRESAS